MEHKIGEIFEIGGEWYQCVKGNTCNDCAFYRSSCGSLNGKGSCRYDFREDATNVIFKKLEKVGEPYMAHDHSRNKDVVVQDYKLYNQHACYNGHEEMLVFSYNGHKGTVTIKTNEPIYKKIKEDMEEKYSELTGIVHEYMDKDMTYKDFKEAINDWVDDYNKLNKATGKLTLKPFDLKAAKQGKPVCTRDGRKARIICFDMKGGHSIVALTEEEDNTEKVGWYYDNGKYLSNGEESPIDLMMFSKKKEGWINIYNADTTFYYVDGRVFETKDKAIQEAKEEVEKGQREKNEYIDTIRVEWEE